MWSKTIRDAIERISIFNLTKGRLFSTVQDALEGSYVSCIEQAGLSDLEFAITDAAMDVANDIIQSNFHMLKEGVCFPYIEAKRDGTKYTILVDLFEDTVGFSMEKHTPDERVSLYDLDSGTWISADGYNNCEDISKDNGMSALLHYLEVNHIPISDITDILKDAASADYQAFYLESLRRAEILFHSSTVSDKNNPYGYIPESTASTYDDKNAAIWMRNFAGKNGESYNMLPVRICIQFGEDYHQGLRAELAECQTTESHLDVLANTLLNILSDVSSESYNPKTVIFMLMDYSYDYAKLCIEEGLRLCSTLHKHIESCGTA